MPSETQSPMVQLTTTHTLPRLVVRRTAVLRLVEVFSGDGEVIKRINMKNSLQARQSQMWILGLTLFICVYCDQIDAYQARAGKSKDFETRMIPASAPGRWERGEKNGGVLRSGMRQSTDDGKTWFWIVR